jgi:hypothetical protein
MVVLYGFTFLLLILLPAYWLFVRPWHLAWGATKDETRRALPSDARVARPRLAYTRAITIHAPPDAVWPWLVQIGYGRAGWYSYDGLERLVEAADFVDGHTSVARIVPELQTLRVGDTIRLAKDSSPAFVVAEIDPNRALILVGDPASSPDASTAICWQWYLEPLKDGATRLLVRQRLTFAPTVKNRAMWYVVELLNFIMERKMLKGIKHRAEANAS